jgi:hypothetical protein
MKFKKPLFLLNPLLLCLSSAASSLAIDVKTDLDRATRFGPIQNLRVAESRNTKFIVAVQAAFVSLTIYQQGRARVKAAAI